jgi:hypothetical protein
VWNIHDDIPGETLYDILDGWSGSFSEIYSRLPTVDEKAALAADIAPSATNKYITQEQLNQAQLGISDSIHPPVQDITALAAIPEANAKDKMICHVEDAGLYRFDSQETEAHNPPGYIKPNDIDPGDPGRWVYFQTGSNSHSLLADVFGADEGDTDTAKDKHVSNAMVKAYYDHITNTTGNPHNIDADDVGLGNVLNTEQIPAADRGVPNGIAELGADGKLDPSQIPDGMLSGADESGTGYTIIKGIQNGELILKTLKVDGNIQIEESADELLLKLPEVDGGEF